MAKTEAHHVISKQTQKLRTIEVRHIEHIHKVSTIPDSRFKGATHKEIPIVAQDYSVDVHSRGVLPAWTDSFSDLVNMVEWVEQDDNHIMSTHVPTLHGCYPMSSKQCGLYVTSTNQLTLENEAPSN